MKFIKFSILLLIYGGTFVLAALIFAIYYQLDFTKPTYLHIVSELCKPLLDSGASEAAMDKCRGEAMVTLRGYLYMWYFGLPSFFAWLSVPLLSILRSKKFVIKTFYLLVYLIAVFIFYIYWIKFWDAINHKHIGSFVSCITIDRIRPR